VNDLFGLVLIAETIRFCRGLAFRRSTRDSRDTPNDNRDRPLCSTSRFQCTASPYGDRPLVRSGSGSAFGVHIIGQREHKSLTHSVTSRTQIALACHCVNHQVTS
jgi:hypothetical protein